MGDLAKAQRKDLVKIERHLTYQQIIEEVQHKANEQVAPDKEWEYYIVAAKKLLTATQYNRMAIAEIACRAVRIVHGGNRQTAERKEQISLLSIGSFAQEIGLKGATLNLWIRIKLEVFDKLPTEQQMSFQQTAGERAYRQIGSKKKYDDEVVRKVYTKFSSFSKKEKATWAVLKNVRVLKKYFGKTDYWTELDDKQLESLNFAFRNLLKRVLEIQELKKKRGKR